jgi:hypothetical protein
VERTDFENDIRHGPGLCRTVKRFGVGWLHDLAKRIEAEFQDRFEEHGARLAVSPTRISGLRTVGEGVALELRPHDLKTWEWWGDFESELEVRRRRRFSRDWQEVSSPTESEKWLRSEARRYLRHLQEGTGAAN